MISKLHRELDSLTYELEYVKAVGDTKRAKEIEHRMKEIEQFLKGFYDDPVTQSISI